MMKDLYEMLVKKKNLLKSEHPLFNEIRYSNRHHSNLVLYPKKELSGTEILFFQQHYVH